MKFTCSIQLQKPFKFSLLGFQNFGGAPNFTTPGYRCAVNLKHLLEKDNSSRRRLTTQLGVSNICYVQSNLGRWSNLMTNVIFWTEWPFKAPNLEIFGLKRCEVCFTLCVYYKYGKSYKTVGEFCGFASGWCEIGQRKFHLAMYVQPYWLLAWSWWPTIQFCFRHIPPGDNLNHHYPPRTIIDHHAQLLVDTTRRPAGELTLEGAMETPTQLKHMILRSWVFVEP